ncbi:MAG: DUF4838 domain-containing protein, partial [Clostridia bacterium]|nr:DUF4838 domain-containing protein [Clostridia bacterium]
AAWLTTRLGDKLTDKVVLGTDASEYGVDVSSLENDGFFIRNLGSEVALFARTTDGLDRAARKYAKAVESGLAVEDETYHEGYRIKRIDIAGRDISEYTIYCENDKYMLDAAKELAERIDEATGVTLAVSTDTPFAPYIALTYVHDDDLSTVGYRWNVTDDGLTIECSDGYMPSSAHYAVVRFLENALGWFGLSFGYETLAEAQLVSLPAGESGGEVNAFKYAAPYGDQYSARIGDGFDHDYGSLSGVPNCCHGFANNRFAQELCPAKSWNDVQPCWLDETLFEVSYEDILAYIERKLAAGEVIGETFFTVDIAQGDSLNWCQCKNCRKMFLDEGGTEAGAVLTWANRVSEALNEVYPGLMYGVFAYAGTNKPPKTVRPNEFLAITYCYDMTCDAHPHDGSVCEEDLIHHVSYQSFPHLQNHNNAFMAQDLLKWTEMCGNVFVWYYDLPSGIHTMDCLHIVRSDMKFFHEIGLRGFFCEAEDFGYSSGKVQKWLMSGLCWNVDMSDEEYDKYYSRVLEALYGDGWEYVKEYYAIVAKIYLSGPCMSSWMEYFSEPMWSGEFDTTYALLERALSLANSAKQEERLVKLDATCLYIGCTTSYFYALEAGDTERVAELERRYLLIHERLGKFGLNIGNAVFWGSEEDIHDDLELEAWLLDNTYGWHYTPPKSEMPARVAAILADSHAAE